MSIVEERWEKGIPHHPAAKWLAKKMNEFSSKCGDGEIDFRFGGDGDNGETICYVLSLIFENPNALREFQKKLGL